MPAPWFSFTSRAGPPIPVAGGLLVPRTQVLNVSLPVANLRFTWNRPTSVTYQPQDGPSQTISVIDYTRLIQILLLAFGLFAAMIIGRIYHE